MIKAAFVIAALAGSGLAAFAVAQESTDEQFVSVGDDRNWYLQRSTCTVAHNVNGQSPAVVRFQFIMGVVVEVLDPALRNVRQGFSVPMVVAVDGVTEEGFGMGMAEERRQGYRLGVSPEMLDRISMGRRLEFRTRGRLVGQLNLTGAAAAIDAMRVCQNEANAALPPPDNMAMEMDMNLFDAMENAADAARNAATPER